MIERKNYSHKGQNGKILVIGGSTKYTGAPSIAAKAALKTGVDLVKIYAPKETKNVIQSYSENFIVEHYKGKTLNKHSIRKTHRLINWSDVTVIGPGLEKPSQKIIKELINEHNEKFVIDAKAIEPSLTSENLENQIFAPHRKEKQIIEQKYGSVKNFADKESAIVVITGQKDKIVSKNNMSVNNTGHPGMTVGGTGDLLTGVIAGLKAQGYNSEKAAIKATKITGLAGEKAAENKGNSVLPQDIIENLPRIIHENQ